MPPRPLLWSVGRRAPRPKPRRVGRCPGAAGPVAEPRRPGRRARAHRARTPRGALALLPGGPAQWPVRTVRRSRPSRSTRPPMTAARRRLSVAEPRPGLPSWPRASPIRSRACRPASAVTCFAWSAAVPASWDPFSPACWLTFEACCRAASTGPADSFSSCGWLRHVCISPSVSAPGLAFLARVSAVRGNCPSRRRTFL